MDWIATASALGTAAGAIGTAAAAALAGSKAVARLTQIHDLATRAVTVADAVDARLRHVEVSLGHITATHDHLVHQTSDMRDAHESLQAEVARAREKLARLRAAEGGPSG